MHHSPPSVRPVGVLRPLQLNLQSLHADLEAVHGLDGSLGAGWVVKAHKAWKQRHSYQAHKSTDANHLLVILQDSPKHLL